MVGLEVFQSESSGNLPRGRDDKKWSVFVQTQDGRTAPDGNTLGNASIRHPRDNPANAKRSGLPWTHSRRLN